MMQSLINQKVKVKEKLDKKLINRYQKQIKNKNQLKDKNQKNKPNKNLKNLLQMIKLKYQLYSHNHRIYYLKISDCIHHKSPFIYYCETC
jgi:hypothetical protein